MENNTHVKQNIILLSREEFVRQARDLIDPNNTRKKPKQKSCHLLCSQNANKIKISFRSKNLKENKNVGA